MARERILDPAQTALQAKAIVHMAATGTVAEKGYYQHLNVIERKPTTEEIADNDSLKSYKNNLVGEIKFAKGSNGTARVLLKVEGDDRDYWGAMPIEQAVIGSWAQFYYREADSVYPMVNTEGEVNPDLMFQVANPEGYVRMTSGALSKEAYVNLISGGAATVLAQDEAADLKLAARKVSKGLKNKQAAINLIDSGKATIKTDSGLSIEAILDSFDFVADASDVEQAQEEVANAI